MPVDVLDDSDVVAHPVGIAPGIDSDAAVHPMDITPEIDSSVTVHPMDIALEIDSHAVVRVVVIAQKIDDREPIFCVVVPNYINLLTILQHTWALSSESNDSTQGFIGSPYYITISSSLQR